MKVIACVWNNGDKPVSRGKLPGGYSRRLTQLGTNISSILFESLDLITEKNIPWVAASRHGDQKRVISLLSGLANKELVLPTDFSFSVHNAIIGMFSIATKNNHTYTALSAGNASFSAGLLEAFALQHETGGKVGYVYYDGACAAEYIDLIGADSQELCIMLILDKDSSNDGVTNVNLNYNNDYMESKQVGFSDILSFIDFFNNKNEKLYKISVPGGQLRLERDS